jgi:beta-phosphoglucomutase-like phosphatase (HAD superfamily)
VLGLPEEITTCLFDLDGVLTDTASVHSAAWKQTFDELLKARIGSVFVPFTVQDYEEFVDGKPRADGVRDFLASRDIHLPEGAPDDGPDALTVVGEIASLIAGDFPFTLCDGAPVGRFRLTGRVWGVG